MVIRRLCALFLLPIALVGVDVMNIASQQTAEDQVSFVPAHMYITPEKRASYIDKVRQDRRTHQLYFGATLTASVAAACATAYYVVRSFNQEQLSLENRINTLEKAFAALPLSEVAPKSGRLEKITSQVSHVLGYALPSMATQFMMSKTFSLFNDYANDYFQSWSLKKLYHKVPLQALCEQIITRAAYVDEHIQFVATVQGYQFRGFQAYLGSYTAVPYDELAPYLIAHVVRAGIPSLYGNQSLYAQVLREDIAHLGESLAYLFAACDHYGLLAHADVVLLVNEVCHVHAELYQEAHKNDLTAQQIHAYCVHLAKLMQHLETFL